MTPPSLERPQRLSSIEYGRSTVEATGMPCSWA